MQSSIATTINSKVSRSDNKILMRKQLAWPLPQKLNPEAIAFLAFLCTVVQPFINAPMDNTTLVINEGDNINFTCEATGYPTPTVIWSRANGDRVSMSGDSTTESGAVIANLIMINASETDTGVYTCTANNSHGIDQKNISVICKYVHSYVVIFERYMVTMHAEGMLNMYVAIIYSQLL